MQLSAFAGRLSNARLASALELGRCGNAGCSPLLIVFVSSWRGKKRRLLVLCSDRKGGGRRGATGDFAPVRDLGDALGRSLSCKARSRFHSRDAKKKPKQVALVSKYALLHNFLCAAVYKAWPRTLCFRKC